MTERGWDVVIWVLVIAGASAIAQWRQWRADTDERAALDRLRERIAHEDYGRAVKPQ